MGGQSSYNTVTVEVKCAFYTKTATELDDKM